MNAVWIVLPILTLLMFELGLTLEIKDFKLFRQRPYPVFAGLIGQIILYQYWLLHWVICFIWNLCSLSAWYLLLVLRVGVLPIYSL